MSLKFRLMVESQTKAVTLCNPEISQLRQINLIPTVGISLIKRLVDLVD